MVGLGERDAVDRRHRIGRVDRATRDLGVEVVLGREAADLVGVERDRRDHDGVLGEVVAEGARADAGGPQQLRRAERVRGDDHQVGRHEARLARAQVLDRDTGRAAVLDLDAAARATGRAARTAALSGDAGSMSGPSTTSAPAQRIVPSGCGSPATGSVLGP